MIREIFVPLMQSPADRAALDSAIALANACHAHVSAMVALEHPVPVVTEFGYLPVEWGQRELELARGSAEAAAAAARARLQRETESSEVRLTEVFLLWSEEAAALQARQADISVMAHPGPDESSPRFNLNFKSLLLNSGRPLLVVPQGAGLAPPVTRAVIAWKPTAEAARAAHDALALLAPACEVDLVMVDPQPREGGHGEEPGADMARHLARHGLRVRVLALPCEGNSEGATLLRHVRESGELVLGGATRSVLEDMQVPVLFSH
jgi:nucleotide-binding universal stress UspA family protein